MKLAVFGSPVAHSLSPVMHEAALAHAGISGGYLAIEVDHKGFISGVDSIRRGDLDGANVTMPHKSLAYALSDNRTEMAERAGAVNTLSLRHGGLRGDNTDVVGIRNAWRWAGLPNDTSVNVLGAGGAAAAALVGLEGREISVVARHAERAKTMIQRTGVAARVVTWGEAVSPGVLVNATSLGMRGESLPDDLLESALGLLDMTYGDDITPAVRLARQRGIPVAAGLDMLIGQAVASFLIWTGIETDPSVMRMAAENELARRAS